MIKFKNILKEDTLKPAMGKMLNIMAKMNLPAYDVRDNITLLQTKFAIKDISTASNIALIYKKYYDELGVDRNFKTLKDISVDYDIDDYDVTIIALHQHLDGIHPELLVANNYGEIEDVVNSSEYRVLTEDEADEEFKDRANEDIDMYLNDSSDLGWLISYVELDDYSVDQFASEDADYRVDDMTEEDIIEEATAFSDVQDKLKELERVLEEKTEKLNEIDNLISDYEVEIDNKQDQIENIDYEISDLTTDRELSTDQEERNKLKGEIYELNIQKYDIRKELSQYEERLEELQIEYEDLEEIVDEGIDSPKSELVEEYKDDVRESLQQTIKDEIEHEGIEYFVIHLGYSLKDAVEYYGTIDRDGAISDMEQDRGDIMSGYDGIEWEEEVNGETYYIYQTN